MVDYRFVTVERYSDIWGDGTPKEGAKLVSRTLRNRNCEWCGAIIDGRTSVMRFLGVVCSDACLQAVESAKGISPALCASASVFRLHNGRARTPERQHGDVDAYWGRPPGYESSDSDDSDGYL